MKTTSGLKLSALVVLALAPLVARSLQAQEPVAPATAAASEDSTAIPDAPVAASRNSKVRIVRLSEVKGDVRIDRVTGKGFEGAMANLPIVEGSSLKTGTGVAEVEFEDNSTIRVAPNSFVQFSQLELLPSGAKASSVHVLQGMVYVNLMNTKGNEFTVAFGKEVLNLPPDSHIRLDLTQQKAEVAVLHGEAIAHGVTGDVPVSKNKTMTFNLAEPGEPTIAKSLTEQPLDGWDHDAVQYHKSYANATSFGNVPYSYGINDMNYYGSFASGCGGSMWRPYFAGANWDPYGSGAWAWYQNAGYSWVSPYPWGWTPYHSGSWAYCDGIGWGWQPGGPWMGLSNNNLLSRNPARPKPPIHAPTGLQPALVPVNLKSALSSGLGKNDTFVFRNGSAGLGVPRGALGKLNSFSGRTEQRGMATTHVYSGGFRGGAEGEVRSGEFSSSRAGAGRAASSGMQSSSMASSSHASGGSSGSSGGGRH